MWRLLIIIILGYLILKLAAGSRSAPKSSPPSTGSAANGPELVRDAWSGVFFDKSLALTIMVEGRPFYFISRENRDLYLSKVSPGSSTKH